MVRFSYELKEERVVAVVDALINASIIEASISLLAALVGICNFVFSMVEYGNLYL